MLKGISELALDLPSKLTNISPKNGSLAKLVQEQLGLVLDKSACQSQWSRRPLRRAQLDYAAADVMALIDLINFLDRE
jgi:ribonuclease D